MPPEIMALINLIGAPAAIVLLLTLRDWIKGRSEAKQADAITAIAVDESSERRQLQESLNHLQRDYMDLRLSHAKEEGRLEELRHAIASQDDKSRKMEARIMELEKYQQINQARIVELEAQIVELEQSIKNKDGEISLLQAQKRELESLLEMQRNRAESLSAQITHMQQPSSLNATQSLPDMPDVDDTITPLPETNVTTPPDANAA